MRKSSAEREDQAYRHASQVNDSSTEGFVLEATGDAEKLDTFIDLMRSYGEIEVTRSGTVAVSLENKKLRLSPPVPAASSFKVVEEEEEADGVLKS